jgi:predicted nuclease of predicted toxin-antitoxin system
MSTAAGTSPQMQLLIDENVPKSVADFFAARGHSVQYVRDVLAAGTPDPIVAAVGDRLSAIVVTWDRDFEKIVNRIPDGNKTRFRRLGRISFKCDEPKGRRLLERWIDHIELHYSKAINDDDIRMIIQIQDSGVKFL